jgi:acyl-CoA thioesterase II
MKNVTDLIALLNLEQIDANTYKGVSKTIGSPNVFGGQVLAQSLNAAHRTVPKERILHSLHSYFLEAGQLDIPIVFKVEIVRDGGSFSTRRVKAMQNEVTIFILAASFHKLEAGYEHQKAIETNIKQPEELIGWSEIVDQFGDFIPKDMKAFLNIERPIEFKPTVIPNPLDPKDLPAEDKIWFKLKGDASKLDLQTKQQILTYISDYNVLNAAINPNASKANFGNLQTASLDHSMWFFRDFDFDDWMLFSSESPNSFGARGLSKGNLFTRDGKLIASFAQEGLIRPKKR